MKNNWLILGVVLLIISIFIAGGYINQAHSEEHREWRHEEHHEYYRGRDGNAGWIVPFLIGGVTTYVLTEGSREAPPPKVVPVPQDQPIYKYDWVYHQDCDCKRRELVRIN